MFDELKQTKFSIKVTVLTLFITLSAIIVGIALGLQFYFSQSLAKDSAQTLFNHTAANVSEKIATIDRESSSVVSLVSQFPNIDSIPGNDAIRPIIPVMAKVIEQRPYLYAVYVGYSNGDFYELINLNSGSFLRTTVDANANERWLILSIQNKGDKRLQTNQYLDEHFQLSRQIVKPSQYYANVRPWFRQALATPDVTIKTQPYIFHSTQTSGITFAQTIPHSNNVLGVDISLVEMSDYLQKNRPLQQSETFIFDANGKISAQSQPNIVAPKAIKVTPIRLNEAERDFVSRHRTFRVSNESDWPPFDFSYSGEPQGYSVDLLKLIAQKTGLEFEFINGYSWDQFMDLFKNNKIDIVSTVFKSPSRVGLGDFSIPYKELKTVVVTSTTFSPKDNDDFSGRTIAIPQGWSLAEKVKSTYPNAIILSVPTTIAALQAVSQHRADMAIESEDVAKYFISLYGIENLSIHKGLSAMPLQGNQNLHFLSTSEQPLLTELINKAINSLTPQEHEMLENKWFNQPKEATIQARIMAGLVPTPAFVSIAKQIRGNQAQLSQTNINGQNYTLYVNSVLSEKDGKYYLGVMVPTFIIQTPHLQKVYVSIGITFILLILLFPILYHFANAIVTPISSLSVENGKIRHRAFSFVKRVPSRIKELDQLSDSIVSMAKDLEQHQVHQQELLDSFIQLIAQSIDQKSPYTGGHCARVPELAIMLAERAHKSHLPAFENFSFATADQRREFEIAAWLHDCGKVTTPEHIIDKGTKLETIYNRIHEVRTRFEVLWRDAKIRYLERLLKQDSELEAQAELQKRQTELTEQFALIAKSNIGTEFMDEQRINAIRAIGKQSWIRHFSDRLGLSPEEEKHLAKIPEKPLPATEYLLDDKEEHILPWVTDPHAILSADMHMNVPKVRANLGEIYNLSIQKGTLTDSDRYRINEHIIATIHMLESLPLPKELSRVPEIAGGHHETLIGTGYPKKLTAKELSIEARILAIADVFEALTASDRPYKKAKTLSQSIDILAKMVKDKHLDADLFKLLLTSGIYQEYATRFLAPEQIDKIDVQKYLHEVEAEVEVEV